MSLDKFRLKCLLRILLLSATIYLFIYVLSQTHLYTTAVLIGLFIILQIYGLLHFVDKTNRDLSRFLQAIKYADFSQSFSARAFGGSYKNLGQAFSEVIQEFQRARAEKEENYHYLQTIVNHIGIGIIGFRENGEVELINPAAKKLFRISHLKNIQALDQITPGISEKFVGLKPGQKVLLQVSRQNDYLQLAASATELKLRQHKIMLLSLHNIQAELEEKEMEAWQNLIRVLTHEIMNSVTPISSLASTAKDLLQQQVPASQQNDVMQDVWNAVKTIEKRSTSLLQFVNNYRKLTRIPKPDFQIFQIITLFERVQQLMRIQLKTKSVGLSMQVDPPALELTADLDLMEQVMINLVKNAFEAVSGRPDAQIKLVAGTDGFGRPVIQVIDNGPGICAEVLEKIFIPFFTTKKEGSGIGLSLSRQIIRLHGGTIRAASRPDQETVFTIQF
jgi:two-component system, NtrC family, nitrogen regulation sensor histidine kinase NtrY